jgi:hypothetical protein
MKPNGHYISYLYYFNLIINMYVREDQNRDVLWLTNMMKGDLYISQSWFSINERLNFLIWPHFRFGSLKAVLGTMTEFKLELVSDVSFGWCVFACGKSQNLSLISLSSRLVCNHGKISWTLDSLSLGLVRDRQSITQCKWDNIFMLHTF